MSYTIIIRGPIGVGKTTIAKTLAKEINAHYVSIDRILGRNNLESEKEEGFIAQKSFIKANELVETIVKMKLQNNIPIVFDGNFYWQSQIEDILNRYNVPNYGFTLTAKLDTCINRDHNREHTCGKDAVRVVYQKTKSIQYGIELNTEKNSIKKIVLKIKEEINKA